MATKPKAGWRTVSKGIRHYTAADGTVTVYVRYRANGKEQPPERIGLQQFAGDLGLPGPAKHDVTTATAAKLLRERWADIDAAKLQGIPWVHPDQRAAAEAQVKAEAEADQGQWKWEAATDRYLAACGRRDLKATEQQVARIGLAFGHMRVCDITRKDVRQYHADRLDRTGPFAGLKRKCGKRTPQLDIGLLCTMFNYWIDEEELDIRRNPAERVIEGLGQQAEYTPVHDASQHIPEEDEQLDAILAADPVNKYSQPIVTDKHRNLWRLLAWTGARPEEVCTDKLHWRHVALLAPEPTITLTSYKRGARRRTIPLLAQAVEALRGLLPAAGDDGQVQAWLEDHAEQAVFCGADGTPWTRHDYHAAWKAATAVAAERFPRLAGMWCRDLRKLVATKLRGAGVDRAIASKIAGHSEAMNDQYTELTEAVATRALKTLEKPVSR